VTRIYTTKHCGDFYVLYKTPYTWYIVSLMPDKFLVVQRVYPEMCALFMGDKPFYKPK
jgi:hypothetical protein